MCWCCLHIFLISQCLLDVKLWHEWIRLALPNFQYRVHLFKLKSVFSFLLISICWRKLSQRVLCSSSCVCTTWVVFSSCCFETDGKGEVYTKRSQVREGRVHQILPGKHIGVKISLSSMWIFILKRFFKNLTTSSNWLYVY